jgi:lipoprotein-releasing system permease protein
LYKLFLTLRYLRKRRIAYFAIAAVTLCVAMVLIVMSVMGGWLDQVKKRARGLLGDVIVDNRAYQGFPLYPEIIDQISAWRDDHGRPLIVRATPVLYTYGLVRFRDTEQTGTVRIVGIRLADVYEVNSFRNGLFYERFYPGTTTLAEQRQPLLGLTAEFDPASGDRAAHFGLPEPYWSALQSSRKAGLHDSESVETSLNLLLAENHLPSVPGEWEVNTESDTPFAGPPALAGDAWPGIILGREIVAKRGSDARYKRYYPKGYPVTVTLWATSARGQIDPIPIKKVFRYADDSRTGIYEIDSQHVYCDFDELQTLLQMGPAERTEGGVSPARCSQIQIKTAPGVDAAALCTRIEALCAGMLDSGGYDLDFTERRLLERLDAMTWEESQAHIIGPVQKERMLVTILFAIISLVAVALVLCILYMIVLQKTRDIGIVKSIGGSSGGVAAIFITYGAAVGLVGSALGLTLGTLFVWYINQVQDFLVWAFNFRVWDLAVYSFDEIPHAVDPKDAAVIAAIGILASTTGSLAAAWRAGSMQPVEAVRYE